MLATNGQSTLALGGTNQQDFKQIQLVAGAYPDQTGLQKRIPGKRIQQILDGPVGSIYVFYMVYGRAYTLIDFGSLQIGEIEVPPITLPGLPPSSANIWFDTFTGYTPDLVSRIWAGGAWAIGIGICETILDGVIDPFLAYDTVTPGRESPPSNQQPQPLPPPPDDPEIPPVPQPPNTNPPQDLGFTDYSIGAYLSSIVRFNNTNTAMVGEDGPPEGFSTWLARGWVPTYLDPVYSTSVASSGLSSSITQQAFVGFNNVAYAIWGFSRRQTSAYYMEATLNISAIDIPPRSQIFLVGTKTLSNGAGSTTVVAAYREITEYYEAPGTITIGTESGIDNVVNPDPTKGSGGNTKSQSGVVNWTNVRVYDSAPL